MAAAHAISWAPERRGEAIIDAQSPLHFGVGFAAGALGVDPHIALMTFVGAKIVEESLSAGPKHAVFSRERGQSLGNELADILFEVAGLYYGKMLRTKLAERQAQAAAATAPAIQGVPSVNKENLAQLIAYVSGQPVSAARAEVAQTFANVEQQIRGLGVDYHDPLTHRYEDYMTYPRIL